MANCKITRSIIRGFNGQKKEMMEADGYYTNGDWLVSTSHAVCQFKPDNDRTPPVKALLADQPKTVQPVERTNLCVGGRGAASELLATPEGEPVCWIQSGYADAFEDFRMYSDGTWSSPVQLFSGDTLVGLIMPMSEPTLRPDMLRKLADQADES